MATDPEIMEHSPVSEKITETPEQVSHSNAAPAQVVSEEHSSLPMTGEGNHTTIYAALLAVAGLMTLRLFKK